MVQHEIGLSFEEVEDRVLRDVGAGVALARILIGFV